MQALPRQLHRNDIYLDCEYCWGSCPLVACIAYQHFRPKPIILSHRCPFLKLLTGNLNRGKAGCFLTGKIFFRNPVFKTRFYGDKMHEWQSKSEGVPALYIFETMPAAVRLYGLWCAQPSRRLMGKRDIWESVRRISSGKCAHEGGEQSSNRPSGKTPQKNPCAGGQGRL